MTSFWGDRPVLVTGAGGFTGRHLATTLNRHGAKVRAFVRRGGSRAQFDPSVEVFVGDLLSREDCRRAVQGIDTVFHVAAVFRRFNSTAAQLRAIHVDATRQLLEEARAANVRRFVHTSTIGVHGGLETPRIDENGPFRPGDHYQATKLEGEQLVRRLAPEIGMPFTIIRPCSIYGPGDRRFLKFVKPMSRGVFAMIGSGEVNIHFVYIDDLVQAFLLAGEKDEALGETFIIGGARSHTLNEFAQLVASTVGRNGSLIHLPVWPIYQASIVCEKICAWLGVEPPLHPRRVGFFTNHRAFSIDKARRLLGYGPETDLRTGLKRLIGWFRREGLLRPADARTAQTESQSARR